MDLAVIRYNAGNIQSVCFALDRLNVNYVITDDPEQIKRADRVIFPGVGEARSTMTYLQEKNLGKLIVQLKQPVLGICLGMQLMCAHSEENDTACLAIFDETVKKFTPATDLKVPHVGWNSLQEVSGWIDNKLEREHVYYVHSYFVPVNKYTVATTVYGAPFSAAMRKDNFFAVQFHPEKSAKAGELVLQSFLSL